MRTAFLDDANEGAQPGRKTRPVYKADDNVGYRSHRHLLLSDWLVHQ